MIMLSETQALAMPEVARAESLTVHQVRGRIGHPDGRVVRVALDDLVDLGLAEYLGGQGNNRRYRAAAREETN